VIKTHPEVGADILAPVPFSLRGANDRPPRPTSTGDGAGYPEGLTGEQIPLGARIVLAVDAFHAMTSDRAPNREADVRRRGLPGARGQRGHPSSTQRVVEALLVVLRSRSTTDPAAGD